MKAVAIGINKLSFKRGVENSSTKVTKETAQIFMVNSAGDKVNTINAAERKKTADPSNVLLNNCVFPNLIPIREAHESEIPKTSRPMIAALSLNISVERAAPMTTHDAPLRIRCSIDRMNIENKYTKIRFSTIICCLP